MLRLRVEDGILLKEHIRPWRKDGWGKPPRGWTPDDRGEWVERRIEEIMAEHRRKNLMPSRFFARRQAANEQGKVFREKKQPWPGWVPVGMGEEDRYIRKAYRIPRDGDYILESGVMKPAEADDE